MGKRLLAVFALIMLALALAACDNQVCHREGSGNRAPPIPFADIGSDFTPALGLIQPY